MTPKSDKMKIFYLSPGSYGSLAIYDHSLTSNLDGDITFFGHAKYDAPKEDGIKYKLIFNYGNGSKLLMGMSYITSLIQLCAYMMIKRPDVLHIQWTKIETIDTLALKFYKLFCKQVVYTAHNVIHHVVRKKQNNDDSLIKKWKSQVTKYYNKVDKIIVHSNITKDELVQEFRIPAEKVFVIPHGVLVSNINPDTLKNEKERLKKEYNLYGKFIFSALGVQGIYKGTDYSFDAFVKSNILKNSQDCVLIIGGKGDIITSEMASEYSNVLVFNELLPEITFQALFELTDVLLLPYRKISQSGVLAHAFSHRIPFIASKVGGLCESLEIGEIGWGIAPNNVRDLRKTMESVFVDRENVKKIKKDDILWNKILKHYSWDRIGRVTTECYSNSVSRKTTK